MKNRDCSGVSLNIENKKQKCRQYNYSYLNFGFTITVL